MTQKVGCYFGVMEMVEMLNLGKRLNHLMVMDIIQ